MTAEVPRTRVPQAPTCRASTGQRLGRQSKTLPQSRDSWERRSRFIGNECEFTPLGEPRPGKRQPRLPACLEHVLKSQLRVAQHPTFAHFWYQRMRSKDISKVAGVCVDVNCSNLTRGELQNVVSHKDPKVRHKVMNALRGCTANIPGSAGHHRSKRIQLRSLVNHCEFVLGGSAVFFPTLTSADLHSCAVHSTLKPADAALLNEECGPASPGHAEGHYDETRTHIFSTNAEVDAHNHFMLRKGVHETGQPALHIRQAKKGKAVLGGVPKDAFFQRGARAMVLRNECVAPRPKSWLRTFSATACQKPWHASSCWSGQRSSCCQHSIT